MSRLFYMPGACSLAAHILVEEIGVANEIIPTLVPRGENRDPSYLAIHPRGLVPALELPDGILTEAVAILLHLAKRYPMAQLLPDAGSTEEARTFEWLAFLTNTLHVAYAGLWRPERFTQDEAAGRIIVAEAKARIISFNTDIEYKMRDGRRFATGGRYTVADPFLLVFFRWANRIGLEAPTTYPAWTSWARRTEDRPAVSRALTREGVSLWA